MIAQQGRSAGIEERVARGKAEGSDGTDEGGADGIVEADDGEVEAAAELEINEGEGCPNTPEWDDPKERALAKTVVGAEVQRESGQAQHGEDEGSGAERERTADEITEQGKDGDR